jgi:hypothetical protein
MVGAFLVVGQVKGDLRLIRLTTTQTRGSHHLPSYSILCPSPRGPHPNDFLSLGSQMGVSKLPMFGLPRLWRFITLCADLRLGWGLNQSCSSRQELFNGMLHATYMQGNVVDSWLSVVGSQIANLTPSPSFGHNLCFRCLNGSCKPILDIWFSIDFQWYKELLNAMGLNPYNHALKIQESTGTPTPKMGILLGVWGSIPSHSLALPGACGMIFGFLLARNLVTPCLGREPKARVATICVLRMCWGHLETKV